jgi:hypothetical protein
MQMHTNHACSILLTALCFSGCGEQAAESSGGSADGGAGGQGGAPAAEPALFVSFVAEEGPGAGPAMLRMYNETEGQILSLTLPTGEAFAFYLIEAQSVSEYALIASDDLVEDTILSLHTLDTCVRRPLEAVYGPTSLEPGRAYGMHISLEDGYVATIEEEAMPGPYVGLRALIDDPAKANKVGAESTLYLSTDAGDLAFEDVYGELPAPFSRHDISGLALDGLRFVDLAGVEHMAEGPINLSGAFGYTIYVDELPVDGAKHTVALTP